MFGISFDTPAENKAFRDEHGFAFPLLCDTDRSAETAYEVLRDPDEQFADFPKRIAYYVDPDGKVAAAEEVTDPGGFAAHALGVLADIAT